MQPLILDLLSKHPQGLTVAQMEKALNITGKSPMPDILRDMHWRSKVRRLRPSNGDVLYVRYS